MKGQDLLYSIIQKYGGKLETSFKELSKEMEISIPRIAYIKDRLVEKGLITSECVNPTGRKKKLILTICENEKSNKGELKNE